MDATMTGFLLVAAGASVVAVLLGWWGRPWTAAAVAVAALLAATPLTRLLPDPVIVAALVLLISVAGWAAWPRTGTESQAGDIRRARRSGARPGRGGAR